jgi:predicted Zn-dependent peptidase
MTTRTRTLLALALAAGCGSKQTGTDVTPPGGGGGQPGGGNPDPHNVGLPDQAFRSSQPPPSEARPFQLPQIKKFQIGGADKIDVYLVEKHELPIISLELNFDGGAMNDAPSKVGQASVCMDLVTEGTAKLDKIAFSEALADTASSVSSYAGDDTQGVSLRSLSRSFDDTFALFVDSLTAPGFRKDEFDRMIKRRLESLKQVRGSASTVAGRVNGVVVYGASHPLGRVTSERTYKALRLQDCKAYHRRWIRPRGARLFVVGDLTEDQIRSAFAPLMTRWKGAPPVVRAPPKPARPLGRIYFVDVPGSAQSIVSLMHEGPQRKADDYFATQLLAQALGSGFSSRINMNLREDKGYSYGAGGGFGYTRWMGTFQAQSSVRADASHQSLLELAKEVRAMHDGSAPATPQELKRDQEGTILGMPARFATASGTLGQYRTLVYFGLPLDYWNSYIDRIKAVQLEEIGAVAKAHLHPTEARYLIIGDGSAPQIARITGPDGKPTDGPLNDADGKQVTLRDALVKLAGDKTLGDGGFVELDVDGKVLRRGGGPKAGKAKAKGPAPAPTAPKSK